VNRDRDRERGGPGPPSGVNIGRLSGLSALWDCVPRVCGGGGAVPAAVCRWGLCPCCPGVGRCLSGVNNHHRGPIYIEYSLHLVHLVSDGQAARRARELVDTPQVSPRKLDLSTCQISEGGGLARVMGREDTGGVSS